MVFGSVLRLLRVDAGASLRELAGIVGVSSAYLSRVENGHDPPPTPDRLAVIARALGVPPSLLVELAERVEPALASWLGEVPAANRLLLEMAARDLNAAQVARVLAFVEAEFPLPREQLGRATPPLHTLLRPERVLLNVRCADIEDVIDLAAARLSVGFKGCSVASLAAALRAREAAASTALGGGLAVPHTPAPGDEPAAALITLATPLTGGPDGLPIRVVLVMAGLGDRRLALLPRAALLARGHAVDALAHARTPEEAIATLEAVSRWMGGARSNG